MQYSSSPDEKILLAEGRHLGYKYIIISYMTHPCCYIQITQPQHPWYKASYQKIDINIKGTLSYSRNYLDIPDESIGTYRDENGWWIGWDYNRPNNEKDSLRQWTTNELIDECKTAILTAYSQVNWNGFFEDWTIPGEYERNKKLNRIEKLKHKTENK